MYTFLKRISVYGNFFLSLISKTVYVDAYTGLYAVFALANACHFSLVVFVYFQHVSFSCIYGPLC